MFRLVGAQSVHGLRHGLALFAPGGEEGGHYLGDEVLALDGFHRFFQLGTPGLERGNGRFVQRALLR